jgi:phenylacetate-CoA ligase
MILHTRDECMSRDAIAQLQIERLQSTLHRAYRNVAFYRRAFDAMSLDIDSIRSLADLRRLPFTTRRDLEKSYPYDMFALPLRDIVRIHSTSGTTGTPVVVGYSRNDLRHWTDCTARVLAAAGIDERDVVQIAFEYSLFTGGLGFHQGAEHLGASVIPSSLGTEERQIRIMRDFKTTALLCTPSSALRLGSALGRLGIHPEQLGLRVGLFGAEPWSEAVRSEIQSALRVQALDNYGLTELMGPGVAFECEHRTGLHVNEDHFAVEVVSPATLEPVEDGVPGEIVLSTLTKEGFPLVRYRTGDVASLDRAPCRCGRTLARLSRIAGRTDDLLFLGGAKFYPSQVEQILADLEGGTPHFRIVLAGSRGRETAELQVELPGSAPAIDELRTLEGLRDRISDAVAREIGVRLKVALVEPLSLREDAGKARRIVDRRTPPSDAVG